MVARRRTWQRNTEQNKNRAERRSWMSAELVSVTVKSCWAKQKNASCSPVLPLKITSEQEEKGKWYAGVCGCVVVCYVPSSLLWLTETVSGAGSSTRGGSQCWLSLTWTEEERQSWGRKSRNQTCVTQANMLTTAGALEVCLHAVIGCYTWMPVY